MSLRSVDLNSLWTGRSHVQRIGVEPLHLYRMDTAEAAVVTSRAYHHFVRDGW